MAASATITIGGQITGTPAGARTVGPISITSAAANGVVTQVVLQAGDNTITIPTSPAPTGCIIQLPSANTSVTTLKGVGGDTGIAIGKTGVMMLCFNPSALPANFILNSVSTQTALITEIIFF
jgi:hypothetical protein